jgi:hypothetical protein
LRGSTYVVNQLCFFKSSHKLNNETWTEDGRNNDEVSHARFCIPPRTSWGSLGPSSDWLLIVFIEFAFYPTYVPGT